MLFFNASWCPTCQQAQKNFEASKSDIPSGLTIVSVDYDNSTELKQRYGVTVQHTFVQIDANGAPLKKWSGSTSVDQVLEQTE